MSFILVHINWIVSDAFGGRKGRSMRIGKACNLELFFLFSESEATPGVKM